ncbi:hypothetical protein EHO58_19415 [Leptospira selangorensis]|uniref:hypothetical protein n=1 Tax=Leptospira selangorensis TaxID=2484982 RepID=UPI001082E8E0|nr:hypothetical protein [Leptospira selangorensis]TGJ99804.1 hypothetical protein EHO58_19415 [Leptospira selangorensis]
MLHLYVVWFQDDLLPEDDQDYEWVACMLIDADSKEKALQWGDHLSRGYVKNNNLIILKSYLDEYINNEKNNQLPLIKYGKSYTDDYIGW